MTTTEGEGARDCAFAQALTARLAGCPLAIGRAIAEREALECRSAVARANCATLRALLRERSTFALRLPPPGRPVTHAVELRLQCGGLAGLHEALPGSPSPADDVHGLVAASRQAFGGLAEIPFEAVVAAIMRWQPRRRATGPGEGQR